MMNESLFLATITARGLQIWMKQTFSSVGLFFWWWDVRVSSRIHIHWIQFKRFIFRYSWVNQCSSGDRKYSNFHLRFHFEVIVWISDGWLPLTVRAYLGRIAASSAKFEEFKYPKLDHPCRPADKCSHPDIVAGEGFSRTPGAPLIGHRDPRKPSDWSAASWPVIGC